MTGLECQDQSKNVNKAQFRNAIFRQEILLHPTPSCCPFCIVHRFRFDASMPVTNHPPTMANGISFFRMSVGVAKLKLPRMPAPWLAKPACSSRIIHTSPRRCLSLSNDAIDDRVSPPRALRLLSCWIVCIVRGQDHLSKSQQLPE